MIRDDSPQGSDGWRRARIGVVTASCADKLLTPDGLKPSKSAKPYMHRLLAERLLGHPVEDNVGTAFTERGIEMEAEAVDYYAMERGVDPEVVGLCLSDDRRIGCSPDRLVGEDGGLEIKCPSAIVHVGYLLAPSSLVAAYRGQVQFSLYVTGRKFWDLLAYNPDIPPVLVRVEPDAEYQAAIGPALTTFFESYDAAWAQLAPLATARRGNIDSEDPDEVARALFG